MGGRLGRAGGEQRAGRLASARRTHDDTRRRHPKSPPSPAPRRAGASPARAERRRAKAAAAGAERLIGDEQARCRDRGLAAGAWAGPARKGSFDDAAWSLLDALPSVERRFERLFSRGLVRDGAGALRSEGGVFGGGGSTRGLGSGRSRPITRERREGRLRPLPPGAVSLKRPAIEAGGVEVGVAVAMPRRWRHGARVVRRSRGGASSSPTGQRRARAAHGRGAGAGAALSRSTPKLDVPRFRALAHA